MRYLLSKPALEVFRSAARRVGRFVVPVLQITEGTGRPEQCGSACVIQYGEGGVVATAYHTVSGPLAKRIILSPNNVDTWPRPYWRLTPRDCTIGDADVAYAIGQHSAREQFGLTPRAIAPGLIFAPGASCIAIGYPSSRSKVRGAKAQLSSELFYVALETVEPPSLPDFVYDARVHIALAYDPRQMIHVSGARHRGADPHGMSGGALCIQFAYKEGTELKVIGIVTRYYGAPRHVMVATRIECLLDAVAPSRPEALRTHAAVAAAA